MSTGEIIGLITGILTIAGVLVAVTRYLTEAQTRLKIQQLEVERDQADRARGDLAASHTMLLEELAAARRAGGVAAAKKAEIDEQLLALMRLADAEAGTVYLPLRGATTDHVTALAFLSIQPVNERTVKLRRKPIPLDSLAGQSFTRGRSFTVADAKKSDGHYAKADQVSGYGTRSTLNEPLTYQGTKVGVLQLLNKRGNVVFGEDDLARLHLATPAMVRLVNEFSQLPGHLELLGISADRDTDDATIMFCDLTASATLFRELNVSSAIQHINEYLEVVCGVAFKHGGTVDKYIGDGVLLRFNVPHPLENHPLAAVRAALEIQGEFNALKQDWTTMGGQFNGLYTRAGLALGVVQKATIGHPQYQYLTVFGPSVNAAVNLCQAADRDRNIVVIDDLLEQKVSGRFRTRRLPASALGKAASYTPGAHEVLGGAS